MAHNKFISGAEVLAIILKKEGIKYIFAYPGTSELAICNSILQIPGLTLINGRGDKESAFMAAGGSLLQPSNAVAILHGARGLTNATGAIADIKRNEIGTVFFVGLPSTSSYRYLPPHGEKNLIDIIGNFTKKSYEITEVGSKKENKVELNRKAKIFIRKIQEAIHVSRSLPLGPTVVGIPQDALEQYWIPLDLLNKYAFNPQKTIELDLLNLKETIALIKEKRNPVILVDDFLYKNPEAKKQLLVFAKSVNAPILQVFYGRGPMLFETLLYKNNPYFIGYYKPYNIFHKKIMKCADLLITIEDRNMYPRVVGNLPNCRKIAITSNPEMTIKNNYLGKKDILLSGNVLTYMKRVSESINKVSENSTLKNYCRIIRKKTLETVKSDYNKYDFMRKKIPNELAIIFKKVKQPILIDDSQMFGGMLADNYEKFPSKLRVFGDHGAFIGSGLAYANGLAYCDRLTKVFSILGDQGFTNAVQGLICAIQEKINIIYIVCNNEKSVSLLKQILSQDSCAFNRGKNKFLFNSLFDYSRLAISLGITTFTITFNPSNPRDDIGLFRRILRNAIKINGPVFIELKLPSDPEAWKGIWTIKGNE